MLDELHLAGVLLYAKIYRHKKVLAIEAMIDALFVALGSETNVNLIQLIKLCYEFCDDQLLVSSADDILSAVGIESASPGLRAFVDDVIARLRNRYLYVSSLALMQKYPADPWGDDKPQRLGLDRLTTECRNEQKLSVLRSGIAAQLRNLTEVIPDAIGDLDPAMLEYAVVISSKPVLGGGTEIDRALILQGERFVRARELDRINQPAWANAYDFGNPQAVLFTPRECAAAAYVAAERLIRTTYNVVLPTTAIELSKQDADNIDRLKRRLEAAGWYAGVPLDIRPKPARLSRQDVESRVERIALKLETIDEPKGTVLPRRAPAMRERILSWLAQFRDDAIIPCAITALERMMVLGRQESYNALNAFVEAHPQFRGATICPLGELKDSGAIQAYLSRDLDLIFPRSETIDDAVKRRGTEPVVLLDDFTASGSQVLDILGTWFDEDNLKHDQLGEARLPFNEEARAFLRSRPVAFVFLAGWNAGIDRIKTAAATLKLEATVYAHLTDERLPFAFDGALHNYDPDVVKRFQSRCRTIGESLLASKGKPLDKQRERALGYGNRAMLLASRFNVPTQTLTCFWMDGEYDGVEWHALIRRRAKT